MKLRIAADQELGQLDLEDLAFLLSRRHHEQTQFHLATSFLPWDPGCLRQALNNALVTRLSSRDEPRAILLGARLRWDSPACVIAWPVMGSLHAGCPCLIEESPRLDVADALLGYF
jgi:hypothetical protein